MRLLKYILENENIKNLIEEEHEKINYIQNILLNYNVTLELLINNSLDSFIVENDLNGTFNNIRDYVLFENVKFLKGVTTHPINDELLTELNAAARSFLSKGGTIPGGLKVKNPIKATLGEKALGATAIGGLGLAGVSALTGYNPLSLSIAQAQDAKNVAQTTGTVAATGAATGIAKNVVPSVQAQSTPNIPILSNIKTLWKTDIHGKVLGTKLTPDEYYNNVMSNPKNNQANVIARIKSIGGQFVKPATTHPPIQQLPGTVMV